jgi:hypothetical protein
MHREWAKLDGITYLRLGVHKATVCVAVAESGRSVLLRHRRGALADPDDPLARERFFESVAKLRG